MSREQSVSRTLRAALIATFVLAFFTGCIFSPEKKDDDTIVEPPSVVAQPEDLIQVLASAYRLQDITAFAGMLANDPDNNAEYLFLLDPSANQGETQWGFEEETRLHQRMFDPENTLPGDPPVPTEYWLTSISITLTLSTPFTERTDLYQSAQNPTGLPADKWKATDAIYATDDLFDTQGRLDFQVTGRANFVVVEDLTKTIGDPGKFLILQWNDLGANKPSPSGELPS